MLRYLVLHWLSPFTLVLIICLPWSTYSIVPCSPSHHALFLFCIIIHIFCCNMYLNILCLSFQIYLFTCIHILLLYLINLRHIYFLNSRIHLYLYYFAEHNYSLSLTCKIYTFSLICILYLRVLCHVLFVTCQFEFAYFC